MRMILINVLAAICGAWLDSPLRRAIRRAIAWRTAMLLEQVDEDARALRELRDVAIPRGFRYLAEEKTRLVEQLERYSDADERGPIAAPLPDPLPASAPGPWSPNQPCKVGPLFKTQRTI